MSRNTKVKTFFNGKNQIAEKLIKQAFTPLLSPKDGKARLTFCGVQHSILEWEERGKHVEKEVMKLAFSCLDESHENPQVLAVTCDYRLSENNKLGKILSIMGFDFESKKVLVDEDDEFGMKTIHTDSQEVFDFLREQCGLVFKGSLKPAMKKNKATGEKYEAKGLYDIAYQTLEPKLLKSGEQERDLNPSDIGDEDFENPNIDMADESDQTNE
jgi:hypothetical protein